MVNETLQDKKTLFSGSAKEAIRLFPKNTNVSIILSLAGIGPERTKVNIVADPKIHKNVHQIDIKGSFGSAKIIVTNHPMEMNPKTSHLAALSVLGTIQRLQSPIKLG